MALGILVDHYRIERCLIQQPSGISLADIARLTGIAKSTLLGHLDTMAEYGRAERAGNTWKPTAAWVLMRVSAITDTHVGARPAVPANERDI